VGARIGGHRQSEDGVRAREEFTEYVVPLLDERRKHPGEDLLSGLVREEIDRDGLSDEDVLGFLRLLSPAGVDTTWLGMGTLLSVVGARPEIHDRLRASAEERHWAVEETLQWESPVNLEPRMVIKDVTMSGVLIPAGTMVRLSLPTANRDPAEFPDPHTWDLDRHPTTHIAFGLGRHFCLGAFLARVESSTTTARCGHRPVRDPTPRHEGPRRQEATIASRAALDRGSHQHLVVELRATPTQHRPQEPPPNTPRSASRPPSSSSAGSSTGATAGPQLEPYPLGSLVSRMESARIHGSQA
jgi:hypothetical protein